MSTSVKQETFISEASPEALAAIRRIAQDDGRSFQSVIEEAMREYIERRGDGLRADITKAFAQSLREFDSLYRELAK